MKRKGFTLIELLAVIVVLAIIALIAVPTVMNIIAKANKSAFKDSAYGIIKAGELYYSEKMLDLNGMESNKTFIFPDITDLDIKGSIPTSGGMRVTKEGKVAIAISNGRYCAKKGTNDTEVVVDENLEDCILSKEPNPFITSADACVTKDGEVCPNGVKVNVKVNNDESYDFYVIKDTGNDLTLIMNKNIGSRIAWISNADYEAAGGTNYGAAGNTEKGPLTLLKALEELTSGWTNLEAKNYTLIDEGGSSRYEPIPVSNARARLLKRTEAKNLGCNSSANSCPSYLKENLSEANTLEAPYGYWTSSAYSNDTYNAWRLKWDSSMLNSRSNTTGMNGIRPVIEISKTI